MQTFDKTRPDLKPYGLNCTSWLPSVMNRPDRHNEIEINFFTKGGVTFLIKDHKIVVKQNQLLIFWALIPHQIIGIEDETPHYVFTIPFKEFVQWEMPPSFKENLLAGELIVIDSAMQPEYEVYFFEKWINDLSSENKEAEKCVIYELHAKLYRIAFDLVDQKRIGLSKSTYTGINLVEKIAICIAKNYSSGINVTDIANELEIHPDYANAIFKKSFNVTLKDYLIDQRISHAQRLLLTSSMKVIDIAFDSGFNSLSRFNVSFLKKCGCTPSKYRGKYGMLS